MPYIKREHNTLFGRGENAKSCGEEEQSGKREEKAYSVYSSSSEQQALIWILQKGRSI